MSNLITNVDSYEIDDLMVIFGLSDGFTIEQLDKSFEGISSKKNSHIMNFIKQSRKKLDEYIFSEDESLASTPENTLAINTDAKTNGFPKKKIITDVINVDTRFRPNYFNSSSTSFTFELPEIQKNVISMKIGSIEMPMTYHTISESMGNNKMLILGASVGDILNVIYENTGFEPMQQAWLVTVDNGNYDTSWASSMTTSIDKINEALKNAVPGAIDNNSNFSAFQEPWYNNYLNWNSSEDSYDLIYSLQTNGMTSLLTDGSNTGVVTGIRFNITQEGSIDNDTDIRLKLGWVLGFRGREYTMEVTNSISSSGVPFLSGLRYCFLKIRDYNNHALPSYIISHSASFMGEDVMAKINLAAGGDMSIAGRDSGYTTSAIRSRSYQGPVDIQKLSVSLIDEYGRNIDLNHMDWSFTLAFDKKV